MTTVDSPTAETKNGGRAVTAVWVVLCVITVVSWWLSPAHTATASVASLPITIAVVVLGIVKSRLIIRYFMEVRTAPRWLRMATDAWLAILWLGVLAIYLY
ncbi:cytochrome C oxidase subunit IV family protein [Mycolicibacterium aichiense]|uniref:cytochrome C oxidase subunit IV family protein n=1 Tax=Mycolicibacterium aichiense TaxID=1799 RepID=UPI003D6764FA